MLLDPVCYSASSGMEGLPTDVLVCVCKHIPPEEQASTMAAMALCSRFMHKAMKTVQTAMVADNTSGGAGKNRRARRLWWPAARTACLLLKTPRSRGLSRSCPPPVRVGAFGAAGLYAFAGQYWAASARALKEEDIEALEKDAIVKFAYSGGC